MSQLDTMEQSIEKIENYLSPPDDTLLQTSNKNSFVGTFLWDVVDLVSFGVLEKPPKKKFHVNEHYNYSEPLQANPAKHYK